MQMTRQISFLALCAAMTPAFGHAQSLPDGVTLDGFIEYEYLDDGDNSTNAFVGDIDLSIAPGSISGGLGFDLGIVGFDAEDTSEAVIFGALTYGLGDTGKLSFGVPRSALSAHRHIPTIGGVELIDLQLQTILEGVVEFAYLSGEDTPYGLRYDGSYGDIEVSTSYHRFQDADADVFDIAGTYRQDTFFVAGGIEYISTDDTDDTLFRIEAGAEADLYSAGIGFSNRNGDDPSVNAYSAWASYQVLPQLDVTATLLDVEDATFWGVSADYNFWSGAYGQIGYLDTEDDGLWDVSLGWRF